MVADVAEDGAAQGPHQEAGGEHAERGNQGSGGVLGREEVPADRRGEVAVDREVVPLHDVAHGAGGDQPQRQVVRVKGFVSLP
jgi:hypothetical protein